MNTAVSKLLDVDKKARQQLDDAQQYYDRTMQEIQQEKQAMEQLYKSKGQEHIHALRDQLDEEVAQLIGQTEQVKREKTAALQAQYDQHHTAWENHLYHAVIGR